MGELTDKIEGNIKEGVGKIKEAIGSRNHDGDLAAEGQKDQVEGKGDQLKGNVKGVINDL